MEDVAEKSNFGVPGRKLFYSCLLATVSLIVWASFGKLAVVSMSTGEVVPSTQVKTVQHLEGGIVREILVNEGNRVKAGESLIVLSSTSSGADVTELRSKITSLRLEIARLKAETKGEDKLILDSQLVANNFQLVREAQSLFNSRREALRNEKISQKAVISQREQDIRKFSATVRNTRKTLKLLNEQITISEDLLRDKLTNRYKHLELLRQASMLTGKLEEGQAARERARQSLKQAKASFSSIQDRYDKETKSNLEITRRQLGELLPRMKKVKDSLDRTILRSPVSGIIKTIYIATIGGVVTAGQAVIDIVPSDDKLVIETKLPTQDIGFVQPGQKAMVKIASQESIRFDSLEGVVKSVSPDTLTTSQGVPFYKVKIETSRSYFRRDNNKYHLFPGMQVAASIHTGERTVLDYLFDPFLGSLEDALTER